MKVTVTGGTGFIGNHVVETLLNKGVQVIVTGTDIQKAQKYSWCKNVTFLQVDINAGHQDKLLEEIASSDKLIHLAWNGLPHYKELFHFEQNLLAQYNFIKKLVLLGLKDITVSGTCFEYGMREGALKTDMVSNPQNPYAIAKDTLRKFLQELQKTAEFKLKWLRLFYMYGKGQSEKSILSQLEQALQNEDEFFNMSGGEQVRDYLPVEEVAKLIVDHSLDNKKNGIYNVCSGNPITIKELVENYLKQNNKSIKLNLDYYPYPDYEPMVFWGDSANLKTKNND